MPIHDARRIEYAIESGHITIVTDTGQRVPAYWAHPRTGDQFAGIVLLHDWWGTTNVMRLLANFFAQMGHYVVAPDMYQGHLAHTPKEAMKLLTESQTTRYQTVNAALSVLESHHRIYKNSVAAIGLGMGGTLAFEAAIKRDDLEATVALAGFPQHYLGKFHRANTPMLAMWGSKEPYIKPVVINALRDELAQSPLKDEHEIRIINGLDHTFFPEQPTPQVRERGKEVIELALRFLEKHLRQPSHRQRPRIY